MGHWLVALAAVAVSWLIARRQLGRATGVPTADDDRMPGSLPDQPFVE
jgi:hypothetical protein